MGSVLVAAMVQEGVAELPAKKFHPFFSKPAPAPTAHSDAPIEDTPQLDTSQFDTSHSDSDSSTNQRKRRNADSSVARGGRGGKKARRNQESENLPNSTTVITPHHDSQIVDDASTEHVVSDFPTPPLSDISIRPADQTSQPTTNLQRPNVQAHVEPTTSLTPPKAKKVLKWNPKTGTLGSPPKPKPVITPTRLVRIKYGRDETNRKEMGDKISQILDGKILIPPTPTRTRAPRGPKKSKNPGVKQATTSQTTHPFFGGKLKKLEPPVTGNTSAVTEKPRSSKNSVFISSPFSPKKTRPTFTIPLGKAPQFGIKSGGTKEPGALHPLWPAKNMSHIRGSDAPIYCAKSLNFDEPPKKSKGQVVTVRPNESVLGGHCENLDLDGLRKSLPRDNDNFEPAPKELRLPKRHFESGRKLQGRVQSELRTYKVEDIDESQDESDNKTKRTHPAISRLFGTLETSLSAYDKSTCETQSWAQKYAPSTASEVLQAGKEAFLLKEWLHTLRLQSVGAGATDANVKGKGKSESAPRKRRKKDKLDGFIVDSDEEADFMDEVSEDEDNWAPAGSGVMRKTVIRSGDAATKGSKDQGRLTNAAVVSGPHGSGKTAAIYAVAKELGFEIFEINSGSRRSGRDLLERVGDMTRNHLVQHHTDPVAEDDEEDEVFRDLKSGKQGMMTAFFKPKPTAVTSKSTTTRTEKKTEPSKQSIARSQKQSLILLEEVDVLYEEDKQFWATLIGMIEQSKRPFIMTCNDESLIPLQNLSLHGIFRFSPPPTALALDLCILVAANEGHLLDRFTVDALYKCRGNDLRATLTELNYWCQIGVGDRRGGFDWFVLRWPKGTDLDENGDVIRVISEGTYCKGMGWMGRDPIATCPNPLESEEEVMRQSWESWKLDLGDWNTSMGLNSWTNGFDVTTDAGQRLDALAAYDDFCDAMSCADILSSGGFGTMFKETLDSTLPEMPTKSRDDFIIGRRLLDADPKASPCSPHVALSISLKSLARTNLLQFTTSLGQTDQGSAVAPVNETRAVNMLHNYFDYAPMQLTRLDLAFAFDPIAVSEKAIASTHLDPSVFDRTRNLIVLDVAPWVRGIVESDHQLMLERVKLSNLLSEGGKRKRMRTTRSAYSALEGGERRATRRERYFGDTLNTELVRRTAGKEWNLWLEAALAALAAAAPKETTENIPSSPLYSGEEE
ncbi:hypothetical protein B0J13DRAFT_607735 [Dactylonectria estremocensis]|uniref:ATPase AAA-type core domain-containing protein n=1 Tax=Dactylonectria estremocensis TaxID=1079267 RepID=A0A9P9EV01_9HYPO|nr:hypothetical protein B0J13DRAFT_607735 [Dactylonectria estremocensis]